MTMRLLSRITRLEESLPPPPGPCPVCGQLEEGGSGCFYGGVVIRDINPRYPGVWWCMCGTCNRVFTCKVERQKQNKMYVTDARFKNRVPLDTAEHYEALPSWTE